MLLLLVRKIFVNMNVMALYVFKLSPELYCDYLSQNTNIPGTKVAQYAGEKLHDKIFNRPEYSKYFFVFSAYHC